MPSETPLTSRRAVRAPRLALLIGLLAGLGGSALAAPPDLSVAPAGLERDGARDVALILAVERYAALPPVPGAVANALDWEAYLRARGVRTVKVLTDNEVTPGNVLKVVAPALRGQLDSGGRVWVVFVGHGAPGPDDHGALVGWAAQQNPQSLLDDSIPQTTLLDALGAGSGVDVVAVVDACFSGTSAEGSLTKGAMPVRGVDPGVDSSGTTTLLVGAKGTEYAGPYPGLGRPAFSWLLLGALRGWGDADGDGAVTADEAVSWSRRQILLAVNDRKQTPEVLGPSAVALSRGIERAPDLAAALRTEGGGSGGGFSDLSLDVSDQLRQQACDEAGRKAASGARMVSIDGEVTRLANEATASWRKLGPEAERCTSVADATTRATCATTVEAFVKQAEALRARLPAGTETAPTECGARSVAFPAVDQAVTVAELDDARALVTKLRQAPAAPPPATASAASSTSPAAGSTQTRVLTAADTSEPISESVASAGHAARLESIDRLKQLIASTSSTGDLKAEMLLRLGDLYFEEGRYFATVAEDATQSAAWREKAVKIYRQILASYPQYARADEATFYLGQALADAGQADEAATQFTQLVKVYPESRYVPDAYVLLGEYYFERNEAFKALLAYQKAAAYKDHRLQGFATYKLAWCYYNVGEYGKAIDSMKGVVSRAGQGAAEASTTTLVEAALVDLVRFYADAGELDAAFEYFSGLGRQDLVRRMLARLADTYQETGKFEQAIQTWRRLVAEDPNAADAPRYQYGIVEAYVKLGRKTELAAEVARMRTTYGPSSSWARRNAADADALSEATSLTARAEALARKAGL